MRIGMRTETMTSPACETRSLNLLNPVLRLSSTSSPWMAWRRDRPPIGSAEEHLATRERRKCPQQLLKREALASFQHGQVL